MEAADREVLANHMTSVHGGSAGKKADWKRLTQIRNVAAK